MMALVSKVHATLGMAAPVLPPDSTDPCEDQLAAVIEARPAFFSFAFGIPNADAFARLRKAGIYVEGA